MANMVKALILLEAAIRSVYPPLCNISQLTPDKNQGPRSQNLSNSLAIISQRALAVAEQGVTGKGRTPTVTRRGSDDALIEGQGIFCVLANAMSVSP